MVKVRNKPGGHSGLERQKRDAFLHRTSEALSLSYDEIIDRFQPSAVNSGRVNRLVSTHSSRVASELEAAGVDLEPLAWYPDGFTFSAEKRAVAALPAITEGRFFIQNASSFIPPLALQPASGDSILDACAAPGAKASHVAALTNGEVSLWLNDGIVSRIERIADIQQTLHFSAETVTTHPAQYLDKYITRAFDRIMVDAQCSGEGLLDLRFSTAFRYWSLSRIQKYRHLQTKMLVAAFRLLRSGGTLVYSTCTVAPEENEAPVSTLLSRESEAAVEPIRLDHTAVRPAVTSWEGERFAREVAGALRIAPEGPFESFFVCRIRKLGPDLTRDQLHEIDIAVEGLRGSGSQ